MTGKKSLCMLLTALFLLPSVLFSGCSDQGAAGSSKSKAGGTPQGKYETVKSASLASSATLTLDKKVSTGFYSLTVPASFRVDDTEGASGTVYFDKRSDTDFDGGVLRQEFDVQSGENKPSTDALLQWLLPNHSEIKAVRRVTDLPTEAYLLKVEQSGSAADSGTAATSNYVVLIDGAKSSETKIIAYTLFLNTDAGGEQDIAKIAQSFKLL